MYVARLRLFFVAFVLTFAATFALPAQVAPATDAKQEIAYAKAAETDPLGPDAAAERNAASTFAENDHTTHVLLCMQLFQEMNKLKGTFAGAIRQQYIISAAAFLYEHPEAATDSNAQNTAGLKAALHVYEKALAQDAKTRSKFLEGMQKHDEDGTLSQAVAKLCKGSE